MKKKIFALIGIVILLVAFYQAFVPETSYWSEDAVAYAVKSGYLEESIREDTDRFITIGEATKALMKYADKSIDENAFSGSAKAEFPLIVTSPEDLEKPLTDEMAAYAFVTTVNERGIKPLPLEAAAEPVKEGVTEGFDPFVSAALDTGIFAGGASVFQPQNPMTYERFSVLLERIHILENPLPSMLEHFVIPLGILAISLLFFVYFQKRKPLSMGDANFFFVICLLTGLTLRLAIGSRYFGHSGDMHCWMNWSKSLYEHGFYGIYHASTMDYPPGYLYILYVMGGIAKHFPVDFVFYKLPAIFFDIFFLVVVHQTAKKRLPANIVCFLDLLVALSAPLIINSALWGQVDMIYMLFIVLFICAIFRGRMKTSYLLYAVALLFKPQALVFAPVLLFALYEKVLKTKDVKFIITNLCAGLCSILLFCLAIMPFGIQMVFEQYMDTMASYPFYSVNGFNIYAMLDLNYIGLPDWYNWVNTGVIFLLVMYALLCFVRGNKNYFALAAMIAFSFYMLSTKIHERYCFPVLVLFLMAYIYEHSKRNLYCCLLSGFTYVLNVLTIFSPESSILTNNPCFIIIASLLNVLILVYILICSLKPREIPSLESTGNVL